jgi:Arc/MetJ-type ribon-helix-helix transcriptional regulator
MARYVHRAQVLLTDEQFRILVEQARQTDRSVADVIREALEEVLLERRRREARSRAWKWFARGDGLDFDWDEFKAEYARAKATGHGRAARSRAKR